LKPGIFYGDV